MPIECKFPVHPVDQETFHRIDKLIMGHAFKIHNELGRFFDERIYQQELAHRCIDSGLNLICEPKIIVTHKSFEKRYFLDILVDEGLVYEMKTVDNLCAQNQTQCIQYLLLAGLSHGKIINMRPGSVESRFISTRLTHDARHRYSIDAEGWDSSDSDAGRLYDTLLDLLEDWGAFLDTSLYKEALIHMLGGEDQVISPIDIHIDGRFIGKQKIALLKKDTAFHLSSLKQNHKKYQNHMLRLLNHTPLAQIHWINFHGNHIQFNTLCK